MEWIIGSVVLLVVVYIVWTNLKPANGITDFTNKVVLITGASSGIGKALALHFSKLGAKVVLVARREDVLNQIKDTLPSGQVLAIPADITQEADLKRVIAAVESQWGRLDILVNNAGIVDTEPLGQLDFARVQEIININLIAPINLIRLALPLLQKQPQSHIVNVSSTVGLTLVPRQSTYGASKAGLNGFSHAMRRELRGTGVQVSMVMPGLVNTPMLGNFSNRDEALKMLKETGMDIPGVYLNEPGEIADTIIDAIRRNKPTVVLGGWLFVFLSWLGQHMPMALDGVYVQMFKTEDLQKSVTGKS